MGVHTLESLLQDALSLSGIDCKVEKYSPISLRKSLLQSGVDCNVPDLHLSWIAGHKNMFSKKAYVNSAGTHHKTAERVIHRKLFHNVKSGYEKEMDKVEAECLSRSSENRRDVNTDQVKPKDILIDCTNKESGELKRKLTPVSHGQNVPGDGDEGAEGRNVSNKLFNQAQFQQIEYQQGVPNVPFNNNGYKYSGGYHPYQQYSSPLQMMPPVPFFQYPQYPHYPQYPQYPHTPSPYGFSPHLGLTQPGFLPPQMFPYQHPIISQRPETVTTTNNASDTRYVQNGNYIQIAKEMLPVDENLITDSVARNVEMDESVIVEEKKTNSDELVQVGKSVSNLTTKKKSKSKKEEIDYCTEGEAPPLSTESVSKTKQSKKENKIQDVNKVTAANLRNIKASILPTNSVNIGDVFFHKLSGYPHWPVLVTDINNAG